MFYTHQNTLIKDLTPSEDEIFASFGKHLRKHIRKAEEDNIQYSFYSSNEIMENTQVLSVCQVLYEKMHRDKGLDGLFNMNLAKKYCKNNALQIIIAKNNDEPIGFSAFVFDKEHARAWVSAFDFRNEKNDPQLFSRAQRKLYWERLKWCKSNGIKDFDFGGINSFTEPNGIAQFKMEFESENKISYDNYLIPNSLLGKIALKRFMR